MQANPPMDPFEKIPVPLVQELILQHLSREEVLDTLTVCKQWNEILSKSKVTMMKVPLMFTGLKFRSRRVQGLMMRSHRTYRNISFCGFDGSTAHELIGMLNRISPSLVKLQLSCILDDGDLPQNIFPFPILESLKLGCCSLLRMIDGRFLKKLDVYVCDREHELLVDFLKQQLRLEELEINGPRSQLFKQKFPVDVSFALDSFSFNRYYCKKDEKEVLESTENFHSFLLQMSPSLRHVEIRAQFSSDLKFIVNRMPWLKSLQLTAFNESSLEHGLKPNISIIKLTIFTSNFRILKILLLLLPNLEDLGVLGHNFTKGDFEWIVRNVKKPKKFRLRRHGYRFSDVRVHYQRLKTEDSSINQDIKIDIIG